MNTLFVIPARGGSKGIVGKNIKLLGGKALLHYSIEYARLFAKDTDICVSTDDLNIANCASEIGYKVPFIRPAHLATDMASSYDVIEHSLLFYKQKGINYDAVVLLQPTSPFRLVTHLEEAFDLFNPRIDMVVSVIETPYNPYYNLFEENNQNLLTISKGPGTYTRRQDAPPVYSYNGSLYIINAHSLLEKKDFRSFQSIKKYIMDSKFSIDLDVPSDWYYAEYLCTTLKGLND